MTKRAENSLKVSRNVREIARLPVPSQVTSTKPSNTFFASFVALCNSRMTMANYFQNFRLQSARNNDSPIIHQETFRHGDEQNTEHEDHVSLDLVNHQL